MANHTALAARDVTSEPNAGEQLRMRFFGVVGAFKSTPPEKALWRVLLDLALGTVTRFEYSGATIPASMVLLVGWVLYGRADAAGVVEGFSVKTLASDARANLSTTKAALTALRRLHVVKMDRPKRRSPAVWRLNLGGLDWPAVRERVKRDSSGPHHGPLSGPHHGPLKGYDVGHDVPDTPAGENTQRPDHSVQGEVGKLPTLGDDGFVFRPADDPRAFEADEGGDWWRDGRRACDTSPNTTED